jgi:hypothetical protein
MLKFAFKDVSTKNSEPHENTYRDDTSTGSSTHLVYIADDKMCKQRLTSFSTKSVGVTWNYALVKKSSGLQYSYMLLYWWNYLSNMDVY